MVSELNNVAALKHPSQLRAGRLLLLSTAIGMGGGAEEQVIRLAQGFKSRGWEALIVSMLPPSRMPPAFQGMGIPLAHLGMRPSIPSPKGISRLARLIRDFRPDVVHSHMTHANLLGRAVRVIQPFPVLVCTLHNLTMAGVKRDWTTVFEVAHRLTDGRAELTTAICHAASDYYIRRRAVPASKMRVVHNGIDCGHFRPSPAVRRRARGELGVDGRFVWLAAGRLELQKAYPTMLRAFARIPDDKQLLLICGKGSLEQGLRALAGELGIGDRVRFLGLRSDIPDMMSAADAFVLSSDYEGLPLVLLQASAAALPIVATDVGGNSEIVVPGLNGSLVPAGDPEALAQVMAQLAALPADDRAALGQAGQKRVQALFEAEQVIDRWEHLFAELLDGAGGIPALPRRRAPAVVEHLKRFTGSNSVTRTA